MGMRATWDALARADTAVFVGEPADARTELESLFGRLGADPRGGLCVEVGCGPGRMTSALAERFDHVIAVDVSPAMIGRAQVIVKADNVRFALIGGQRLDGLDDDIADVVVCYLVLQHLPRRQLVEAYLREFARVLRPDGEAFVQLPILAPGLRPRLWRTVRTATVPLVHAASRRPRHAPALRGVRVTERELERGLAHARLDIRARDHGPHSPYRYSRDVFLRLARAA